MTMGSTKKYLILGLLLLVHGIQYAGIEESTVRLNNPTSPDQNIVVVDHQYDLVCQYMNYNEIFFHHQIDDIISVGIIEENQSEIENFDIRILIEYVGYDEENNPQSPQEVELHLKYLNGKMIDSQSSFVFNGYLKFSCRIIAVTNQNNLELTTWPNGFFIEAVTKVDRVYKFDPNYVAQEFQHIELLSDDGDLVANELMVSWDFIPGAEYYELEWTFINDYKRRVDSGTGVLYLNPNEIDFDKKQFKYNSTRVQTTNNYYRIPLTFEHGYLIYRIRGVGRGNNNYEFIDKLNFGKWSDYLASLVNANHLENWISNYNGVYACESLQNNLNWEYTATYAESGMRKDVVAYFDGLLRSRQVVTKLNSTDKSVVGESFYDASGRSAVTVLPAPTGFHHLNYHENLSLNNANEPYSYFDFDFSSNDCGSLDPAAMSTISGASHYFGPTLVSNDSHDFVPDAEQYPFSAVQYMKWKN
jgi:hypothetical protein